MPPQQAQSRSLHHGCMEFSVHQHLVETRARRTVTHPVEHLKELGRLVTRHPPALRSRHGCPQRPQQQHDQQHRCQAQQHKPATQALAVLQSLNDPNQRTHTQQQRRPYDGISRRRHQGCATAKPCRCMLAVTLVVGNPTRKLQIVGIERGQRDLLGAEFVGYFLRSTPPARKGCNPMAWHGYHDDRATPWLKPKPPRKPAPHPTDLHRCRPPSPCRLCRRLCRPPVGPQN